MTSLENYIEHLRKKEIIPKFFSEYRRQATILVCFYKVNTILILISKFHKDIIKTEKKQITRNIPHEHKSRNSLLKISKLNPAIF